MLYTHIKSVTGSRVLAVSLLVIFAFFSSLANAAPTASEKACYSEVQGKVAWNQQGNTAWSQGNVEQLCAGVLQSSERISCFKNGILAHDSWSQAISDCAATGGGAKTEIVAGKQCIYNKGGYALTVEWYNPGLIVFNGGDAADYSNYTTPGKPHSSESITLGYSSCTDAANRSAVVRIVGHDIANTAITIAAGTVTGVTTGVLGAFACVGTAGVGCPAAVAGVAAASTGAVSAVGAALPSVNEIAYIGVPGSENYLDFYGTIWKVGISNDIALTEERKPIAEAAGQVATTVTDFVDGGTRGAKSITFNNQAGYVANMAVIYYKKQNIGGQLIPMPVVKQSGNITAGLSRHIDIPNDIENTPIVVSISGVGTFENDVYSNTVPANFTGNRCFKSWGTIFDTEGGACN